MVRRAALDYAGAAEDNVTRLNASKSREALEQGEVLLDVIGDKLKRCSLLRRFNRWRAAVREDRSVDFANDLHAVLRSRFKSLTMHHTHAHIAKKEQGLGYAGPEIERNAIEAVSHPPSNQEIERDDELPPLMTLRSPQPVANFDGLPTTAPKRVVVFDEDGTTRRHENRQWWETHNTNIAPTADLMEVRGRRYAVYRCAHGRRGGWG